jgi:organic hydroperoxide reductase OsmC/OhrA
MTDQVHRYETSVQWAEARRGALHSAERPRVAIGAPPEFGGSPDVWSPEHLCVAAVNACVMLTFLTIASNSKVAVRSYDATATGTLEKVDGRGMEITRIDVRPRVGIGADVDRAKVERLLQMAERNCYVSNSLKGTVSIQPELIVE